MKKKAKDKRDIPITLLSGLDEIGHSIGAGPKVIRRWIREKDFPAVMGDDGTYRADPDKIKEWLNWQKSCQ